MQEQVFAAEGITIQPVCSAEEIEVITGLIENGFGISVLPYMDIVHLHNLVAIPVQTPIWKSKFYREKKIWKPLRGNRIVRKNSVLSAPPETRTLDTLIKRSSYCSSH